MCHQLCDRKKCACSKKPIFKKVCEFDKKNSRKQVYSFRPLGTRVDKETNLRLIIPRDNYLIYG